MSKVLSKTSIYLILLLTLIGCSVLGDDKEWKDMSDEESLVFLTSQFGELDGVVILKGQKETKSWTVGYYEHKRVYFSLPGVMVPKDWLTNLVENLCTTCSLWQKLSDYKYSVECESKKNICQSSLEYSEKNNYKYEYEYED